MRRKRPFFRSRTFNPCPYCRTRRDDRGFGWLATSERLVRYVSGRSKSRSSVIRKPRLLYSPKESGWARKPPTKPARLRDVDGAPHRKLLVLQGHWEHLEDLSELLWRTADVEDSQDISFDVLLGRQVGEGERRGGGERGEGEGRGGRARG